MKTSLTTAIFLMFLITGCTTATKEYVMTVNGPVEATKTGIWLTHEHILVDFIGADSIKPGRYISDSVRLKALPFLREAWDNGCRTFAECTPEYLGRDPLLLKALSDSTGINILTNTGWYGAMNNKYIPSGSFEKSAEEISRIWIDEWINGIESTGIRPGFIKIGVNRDSLSGFHARLARAAALTHLETGLVIASHSGPAIAALPQIEILMEAGVSPEAFIWVHAQNEKDPGMLEKAAALGSWISLDNFNEKSLENYLSVISNLKEKDLLSKVLISHDAGWYDPAKKGGGDYRGYSAMFDILIPALREKGFTEDEISLVFEKNPAKAFSVRVRNLK